MTPQIAYALIVFLLIWTTITYSLPLAQSIVELLKELDKWQVQTTLKDAPAPAPAEETR